MRPADPRARAGRGLDLLAADDIDLALTYDFNLAPAGFDAALETVPLWEADWGLGVPAADPPGVADVGRGPGPLPRQRLDRELAQQLATSRRSRRVASLAGFVPRVVHRADSLELVEDLIVAGLGVGLLPAGPAAGRRGAAAAAARTRASTLRAYAVARRGRTAWPPLALVLRLLADPDPFAAPRTGHRRRMSHAAERRANAPEPDSDAKPDSPKDLTKPSWGYIAAQDRAGVLRRPVHRPGGGADLLRGAGAVPGAARAGVAARPGRAGPEDRDRRCSTSLKQIGAGLAPSTASSRRCIELAAKPQAPGSRLVIGLAGALWSASGYVGAFGRAMNRIYEIREGRPFWKLRPLMLARHPRRARPRRRRRGRAGGVRPGRHGGRQRDRRRVDGGDRVEHRQVAGDARWSWCSSWPSSTTPPPT